MGDRIEQSFGHVLNIPMNEIHLQRKRLAHRATYRSVKEADLLLAPLAKSLPTLPEHVLDAAEQMIDERDDKLLAWAKMGWPEAYKKLWAHV